MLDPLKLSQALNSRLCHEIAGLIGAFSTSVEVISEKNKALQNQAENLLNVTSKQLTNVVNFYRIAYGFSAENFKMDIVEVKALCESITHHKLKIKFIHNDSQQIDSDLAKVILCLIVSLSKSVIREGEISVLFYEDLNEDVKFKVSSKFLKNNEEKLNILSGNSTSSDLSIYNCHEYYVHYLIKGLGLKILIERQEDIVIYSLIKVN